MTIKQTIDPSDRLYLLFKSPAIALLFAMGLGPIGLLYATIWGGVIMLPLFFIVFLSHLLFPIILVWVVCCIWSMIAVHKHNRILLHRCAGMQGSSKQESICE